MKNVVVNAQEVSIESGTWNWKTCTQRKNIFERTDKVWSKLNSVEKWSLAIWPCPGAAVSLSQLPARVNTKAVYNTREAIVENWHFLITVSAFAAAVRVMGLWYDGQKARKTRRRRFSDQTRLRSARLASTTVLYSAGLSEPRGTGGGNGLPRFW